jgi:hypothetical protein
MENTNLKIGFFGHSIAVRDSIDSHEVEHFIDKLIKKTGWTLINEGVILGSEERTLYEIKKHGNNLDVAVIFHSNPIFYFSPKFPTRDFRYIGADQVFDRYKKNVRGFDPETQLEQGIDYELGNEIHESFFRGLTTDRQDFINGLKYYNKYFYDYDLQVNRYHGALSLIDQYLLYKKIPVIHSLPVNKNLIPKWFSFKSGIIDNEMQLFQTNEEYREDDHRKSSNRVNQLGNDMLCNYTLRLINQAFDKIQDEK